MAVILAVGFEAAAGDDLGGDSWVGSCSTSRDPLACPRLRVCRTPSSEHQVGLLPPARALSVADGATAIYS